MAERKNKHHDYDYQNLTDREFDLIKLEINLLEQRILHLENIQYRLRQFSMILWLATLGVGLGVNTQGHANFFIICISSLIPLLFIYLDAWYASSAQSFRSRRNEISRFFNTKKFVLGSKRERMTAEEIESQESSDRFPLLDITGTITISNYKKVIYRKSILIKLTRTVRLWFYGFQIFGSLFLLSNYLAINKNCNRYYFIVLSFPILYLVLHGLRYLKKQKIVRDLPPEAIKDIKPRADELGGKI